MPRIKERNSLLSDLALELRKAEWSSIPLDNIKVKLYDEGGDVVATFLGAADILHYLVEDIYTDNEEEWDDAVKLTLESY